MGKPRELPPNSFTYGNYNADIPFAVFMDDKALLDWLQQHEIVGYSKHPSFKQQEDYTAVLINNEMEMWEAWNHIPNRVWERFMKIPEN